MHSQAKQHGEHIEINYKEAPWKTSVRYVCGTIDRKRRFNKHANISPEQFFVVSRARVYCKNQ